MQYKYYMAYDVPIIAITLKVNKVNVLGGYKYKRIQNWHIFMYILYKTNKIFYVGSWGLTPVVQS